MIAAIVPIRTHSTRLPGKNFLPFNGKPLWHWIILTLDAVSEIDKIIVDTDDERVLRQAPNLSSKVHLSPRPEHLCGSVKMYTLLAYDMEQCQADLYIQTHCTSPLLKPETISRAIAEYYKSGCQFLMGTVLYKGRFYDENGPINHDPVNLVDTQVANPVWEENASLYLFTKDGFHAAGGTRVVADAYKFEISKLETADIDDYADFRIAEIMANVTFGS